MNNHTNQSAKNNPRPTPTNEQIAVTAFHLYAENGYRDGHALEDWLAAEQLLTREISEAAQLQKSEPQPKPVRQAANLVPEIHPAAVREHPLARDERGSPSRKEIRQMAPRRPASRH